VHFEHAAAGLDGPRLAVVGRLTAPITARLSSNGSVPSTLVLTLGAASSSRTATFLSFSHDSPNGGFLRPRRFAEAHHKGAHPKLQTGCSSWGPNILDQKSISVQRRKSLLT
jgi:hypothetical protein